IAPYRNGTRACAGRRDEDIAPYRNGTRACAGRRDEDIAPYRNGYAILRMVQEASRESRRLISALPQQDTGGGGEEMACGE
ncbi:MAG: hypothetical protein ACI4QT_02010, partial [Kiritimatiellia bacterium]